MAIICPSFTAIDVDNESRLSRVIRWPLVSSRSASMGLFYLVELESFNDHRRTDSVRDDQRPASGGADAGNRAADFRSGAGGAAAGGDGGVVGREDDGPHHARRGGENPAFPFRRCPAGAAIALADLAASQAIFQAGG